MDHLDLIILAYRYERHGETELAEICRKSALYIAEKEKSTTLSAVHERVPFISLYHRKSFLNKLAPE